jgi:hypothetical protein
MKTQDLKSTTKYYAPGPKKGWTPVFSIYRNRINKIFYIYNVGKCANKGIEEMNRKFESKKSS